MRRFLAVLLAILGACSAPRHSNSYQVPSGAELPAWLVPSTIETAAILDAKCPLDAPVLIQVEPLGLNWGDARFDEEQQRYVIRLDTTMLDSAFYETVLLHEWAHCLTECNCPSDHCGHWGSNFARCYRAIMED